MSPKSYKRAVTILVAAVFLLPPAFGQVKGGTTTAPVGGGTSTGTGTGTTTIPGRTTPTTTDNNPQQTTTNPLQNMPMPVPITGRVMLDDGGPPSETVVIERV